MSCQLSGESKRLWLKPLIVPGRYLKTLVPVLLGDCLCELLGDSALRCVPVHLVARALLTDMSERAKFIIGCQRTLLSIADFLPLGLDSIS